MCRPATAPARGPSNFQAAVTRQINPSALRLTGNIQINNPNGFALVLSDVQVELRRLNGQNLILPASCSDFRIPRNSVLNCNFLLALPVSVAGLPLAAMPTLPLPAACAVLL